MPTLHVLQGPDKGRTYNTPREPTVIGRTSDHIQLSDNGTSRRHAEIRPENGLWLLTDLDSSNGTFLNGQRIAGPTALNHGDQIRVGSTLLVFSGQEGNEGVAGVQSVHDLVDLDTPGMDAGSSILSAINASEESVILQSPETADAAAAWNVVYRVAESLGSIESIDTFLERVSDIIFEDLAADRLALLMCEPDCRHPVARVVRSRMMDRGVPEKIVTSRKIINHVLDTHEGILCANAMTDVRFPRESPEDSIASLGLRSVLCVPIVVRDRICGLFHLDCSMAHHSFTQEQLRLVVAIGRLVGMALENAELQESRVHTERLAAAGETVAYLSHSIRNILQGMQSGAEIVEMGIRRKAAESIETGWSMVRRNLDRIFVLAMNMLTFSKERKPCIVLAQLNRIIEDVVALSQNRADEKGVMLLTELEDLPAIPLDEEGMHQVVHNIVLNAIDVVPEGGGRINISSHYDEAMGIVILSITDNGPGIPPEQRDKIFDPFHSSKGHGGTGLGLAAALKIVTELNGTIDVESAEDKGTTFRVSMPAAPTRIIDRSEMQQLDDGSDPG